MQSFEEMVEEKAGELVKWIVQKNIPNIIAEAKKELEGKVDKMGCLRVNVCFDYCQMWGSDHAFINGLKLSFNRKIKFEDKETPPLEIDGNQLEIDFEEEKENEEEKRNCRRLSEVIFNISDIAGTKRKVVCPCLHGKKGNMDKWEDGEEVACNYAPAALVVDAARKVGAIVIDDNWMMSDEDVRWLAEEGARIRKYENGKWWIPAKEDGWEPLPEKFKDFDVSSFLNQGGIVLPINLPR